MADSMFGQGVNLFDIASGENADIRDRAKEVASLSRGSVGVYANTLAGGMVTQGLARMAGLKTVDEEKAEIISDIMQESVNLDPNDPKSLYILSDKFIAAGFPDIGSKFRERGRELDLDIYKADTDRISAMSSGSSYDPGTFRKSLNTAALILGYDPENMDADQRKEAYKLVLDYKRENRWNSESVEALAEEMVAIQTEGNLATGEIAKFQQMLTILPEIYTGWGAGAWKTANMLGAMIGLPEFTKAAGQMEMFAQGGMEMALKYIQQTKGAVSDREFEAFLASAPGLSRTQLGNQLMLETAMKYAQYNQDKAAEYTRWIAGQKAAGETPLYEDWSEHLIEWSNKEENIIKLPTDDEYAEAISAPSSIEADSQLAESVDDLQILINEIENQE